MRVNNPFLLAAFLGFILVAFPASAQEQASRISLMGSVATKAIASGSEDEIIFWGISRGNISTPLSVALSGPKGVRVKIFAKHYRGNAERALARPRGFYRLALKDPSFDYSKCLEISEGEEDPKPEVDIEDYPETSAPACDAIGASTLNDMAAAFSETYGGEWRPGNVCSYILANQGQDAELPAVCSLIGYERLSALALELQATHGGEWGIKEACNYIILLIQAGADTSSYTPQALLQVAGQKAPLAYTSLARPRANSKVTTLHKDACNSRGRYLVKIVVSTKRVAKRPYPFQQVLSLSVRESRYSGDMRAALKPKSEGGHSPAPIIMMNYMGNLCGNLITAVSWRNARPQAKVELEPYSLLKHRDMVLALAVATPALTGGWGTFELSNSLSTYGVCIELVRERQNVNGY